ncbi:hypothetical protein LguiB_024802 [Lonicera macranthoides]
MAESTTSNETTDTTSQPPGPDNTITQPDPSPQPPPSSSSTPPTILTSDPNPNPNLTTPPPPFVSLPQPPSIQPYSSPSFRPALPSVPLPTPPQFSPIPNSNFQAHNFQNPGIQVQPPGVSTVTVMMPPPPTSGVGSVTVPSVPPPMMSYVQPGQPPNPAMRPYAPMPNGYAPPPGILRYPSVYSSMVRPAFPPRPLGPVGFVPALSRPPMIRGPVIPPVIRPAIIPSVTPTEKPQTTVYVGKISSTVENDFMLSLLQLCGPVKSWKRPQDSTNGALKGFGFCEFDSAEGVLRALRLLSKLSVDGQQLMLNVNQATREYLERYVEKKKENSKNLKATQTEGSEKEETNATAAEKEESSRPSAESSKEDDDKDAANKESKDLGSFGLVTDEDKEADREASEKLTGMMEERLKTKPLPPPPPPPLSQTGADASGNSNSEHPARSRDGDSDVDITRQDAAEDRNDDETTSGSKPPSEPDKLETTSPDRNRRSDRRSRDRERDLKREKERELERLERDREQERAKRERDREYKNREDERRFRARLKEWESREREREHLRKQEREREKEREQERKWEISDQERENDDGYSKKRKYKSSGEDRKRRQREKEEDMADRLKEEEEIAEAKRRAEEERQQQKEQESTLKTLLVTATNGSDKAVLPDETNVEMQDPEVNQTSDGDSGHGNHNGDDIHQNGIGDELTNGSTATSDTRQCGNAPTRKLGFGLVGSGKRTAVPSVFHEEEDEDAHKEKKMRPLVPIDYSTEELQVVRDTMGAAPSPNLAAAAEFAKRIANVNPKEDRPDAEKERSRRTHERSSHRDRDRNDEVATHRTRDETRTENADRERGLDKVKTQENRKLLDAKQLIDTIPKTKDELFSYEINWAIYDKNDLHEKMRPWISKKITEFLGEEETTLVDYIVSSTREHVKAPEMLDRLQSILDDEAEMFVLKMWRMLIFEVKRVETGLASKSKT